MAKNPFPPKKGGASKTPEKGVNPFAKNDPAAKNGKVPVDPNAPKKGVKGVNPFAKKGKGK